MRKGNLEAAADMIDQAAEAVSVILAEGVSVAMNRFNRRATPPDDDEGGGHNGHEHEHGGEG
jgi:hypothetical protein